MQQTENKRRTFSVSSDSAPSDSVYVLLLLGEGAGAAVDLLALATRAVPLVMFLRDL